MSCFGFVSEEDKREFGTESDGEDLEAPLPLRSDEELFKLDHMRTCGEFMLQTSGL